jgi:hypothetical protein
MEVGTSRFEPQGNATITFLVQTDLMPGKIESTATLLRAKVNGTKYKTSLLLYLSTFGAAAQRAP